MRYMLDTNIVSDLLRHPAGPAAQRARAEARSICVSIVVAAELRFGLAKRRSPVLQRRVEDVLARIPVLAFESPADVSYGSIRAELEAAGTPIGGNDLLIAAHARTLDATLVTANVSEFQRVRGLSVENWAV